MTGDAYAGYREPGPGLGSKADRDRSFQYVYGGGLQHSHISAISPWAMPVPLRQPTRC